MGFSVPCTSSFSELPFNAIQSLQTQSSTPTWVWVYIGSTSSFVPFPCFMSVPSVWTQRRGCGQCFILALMPGVDVTHLRGKTTNILDTKNMRWYRYFAPYDINILYNYIANWKCWNRKDSSSGHSSQGDGSKNAHTHLWFLVSWVLTHARCLLDVLIFVWSNHRFSLVESLKLPWVLVYTNPFCRWDMWRFPKMGVPQWLDGLQWKIRK